MHPMAEANDRSFYRPFARHGYSFFRPHGHPEAAAEIPAGGGGPDLLAEPQYLRRRLIFKLPNSGLDVSNCTKYFKISPGGAQLLEPDLLGPLTEADDCSGRDAVLEAVLRQ
jgi:hypothetical protein